MSLIIVESPTKARTFNRLLKGKEYYVFATMGHIRDLPSEKMAIDYDKNFKPDYTILKTRDKIVAQLKKLGSQNDEIILATDLDREGEAISYHIAYILGLIKENWPDFKISSGKKTLKRIVFHEITAAALEEALSSPGELRPDLIKAQQARRILDRIVGYELSPLLWAKTGKNWLSAGRVQTIALRLIVEREKEIEIFSKEKYFQILGDFSSREEFQGKLIEKNGVSYQEQHKIQLFDGEYQYTKTSIDEKSLKSIIKQLEADSFKVSDVIEEVVKRYPPPPFTTSLLQQEAFQRYSFSSKMTMRLAQNLYERGLITYHRTDSFNLSTQFVFKAKDYILENFGAGYALDKPRGYKTRSKLAQEAHEAIRPTNITASTKEVIKKHKLTASHLKIYELIFHRALATQMKEAEIKQIKVFVKSEKGYLFETEFQKVLFDGFFRVLSPEFSKKHEKDIKIKVNESVKLKKTGAVESFTKPPYRYNEATLIRTLEEKGIGRPSTYAPIISLIQEKLYVDKDGRYFKPTSLGTVISDYLSSSFPRIFDINFTAKMEEGLDEIAGEKRELVPLLKEFYGPFKEDLDKRKDDKTKLEIKDDINELCSNCGKPLTMRYSKFGKFLACTGYPSCKYTKTILKTVAGKNCPLCEAQIVVRYSKKGKRFFGCANYPKCKFVSFSYNGI